MGKRYLVSSSVFGLAFALSACGGAGGGVSSTPTPSFDTAEYRASSAAVAASAISAYNAGATGKGVKIGIIDTGVNSSLGEFSGKLDAGSVDIAGGRGMGDEDGHGTMVSAIAA